MKTRIINAVIPAAQDTWQHNTCIEIDQGRITGISQSPAALIEPGAIDMRGRRLLPGFIDTQVNGGGGVLFNDTPTVEGLAAIAAAHRRFGTTGLMPTLISDDLDVMAAAIDAVDRAIAVGVPGILGIHLEGPFLNTQRKGVHNPAKFRHLEQGMIALLTSLKRGKTLVTLAPENTTPDMIRTLAESGIIVAAGHTAANYSQIRSALDHGLCSFTHLFNAMTPLASREPGVVGAALEDDHSWCGIIVDGHHVHPTTLKLAVRAKARGKMVLVTDAMPTVGAANKTFVINGEHIEAREGRCATATGTLAGSDLDMLQALTNTVKWLDLSLQEASRMASLYPAQLLGLDRTLGSIAVARQADFLVLDDNDQLCEVWQSGQPCIV